MKVLFITSSRIGDAVLSTGLLNHIGENMPGAKVTIVCGPLAVSLFQGYPYLDKIIPLKKEKNNGHWVKLWKHTVGTRWDMIIDLRNSLATRFLLGRRKHYFDKKVDKARHKVQQNASVMKLEPPPAPKLWFTNKQKRQAQDLIPDGDPVLAIGPTANWAAKTWPHERFVEIMQWITAMNGYMPEARVAVFAAPGEEHDARQVLKCVPPEKRLDIIAKTDPGTAAATLARCDFYLGNDSGLMHCAAAAGVPTFGVFGPSHPHIYKPWGDHCTYAQTPETFDELINYEGYSPKTAPCLMNTLTVDMVKEKLTEFFENNKKKVA